MKAKSTYLIPELARELNITASIVFYKLWQWQMSKSKHNRYEYIEGVKAAFRSYTELADDLPWLDRSAIHKAVKALKEYFEADFLVECTEKNRSKFLIRSSLAEKYGLYKSRKSGRLSFDGEDAAKYGVIEAIILKHCSENGFSLDEVKVSQLESIPACNNTLYAAIANLKRMKITPEEKEVSKEEQIGNLRSELQELLAQGAIKFEKLADLEGKPKSAVVDIFFKNAGLLPWGTETSAQDATTMSSGSKTFTPVELPISTNNSYIVEVARKLGIPEKDAVKLDKIRTVGFF